MIKIFSIFFLFFSISAFAFDKERCLSKVGRTGFHPLAVTFSSSEFTSSWGECAAISMSDKQKQFLALNSDSLKLDSSMGEGPYLTAYTNLLGCSPQGTNALKTGLQTNYPMIWGQDSTKSPEEAYKAINSLIRADSTLSKECASGS